jgi:hypothetical protein
MNSFRGTTGTSERSWMPCPDRLAARLLSSRWIPRGLVRILEGCEGGILAVSGNEFPVEKRSTATEHREHGAHNDQG